MAACSTGARPSGPAAAGVEGQLAATGGFQSPLANVAANAMSRAWAPTALNTPVTVALAYNACTCELSLSAGGGGAAVAQKTAANLALLLDGAAGAYVGLTGATGGAFYTHTFTNVSVVSAPRAACASPPPASCSLGAAMADFSTWPVAYGGSGSWTVPALPTPRRCPRPPSRS
jgi:hypothetical protein